MKLICRIREHGKDILKQRLASFKHYTSDTSDSLFKNTYIEIDGRDFLSSALYRLAVNYGGQNKNEIKKWNQEILSAAR